MLRNPVPSALEQTLADASKGVLVVDGAKMPTLVGWGTNYLTDLADFLNDANVGDLLELPDQRAHGAVRMRSACVSVIGSISALDAFDERPPCRQKNGKAFSLHWNFGSGRKAG